MNPFDYSKPVADFWTAQGQAFMVAQQQAGKALAEGMQTGASGPEAPDVKAVFALWAETANRQLLETQRSEPFLATQAAMIRASTELRLAQQELVEHFGRQYGFPTRTELDDVHRTVTELRREIRAMRRAQQLPPSATPPAASTGQPPATPRARQQNPKKRGPR